MMKKFMVFSLVFIMSQTSFALVKNTMFGEVYNKYDRKSKNMILTSNEHNQWELIDPIEDATKHIEYTQATCSGNNCISLGYQQVGHERAPVMLTTQDGGINWKQIKYINGIHTKVSYLQGTFDHAICYNNRCFAAGLIKDVAVNDQSYSYIISEDGGSTWTIPNSQHDMKSISALPRLDFYCIQNQCVSRVEEKSNYNNVLVSQDGGDSWKLVKLDLPGSKQTAIVDLKASNHKFIAIGNYKNKNDEYRPLIMVSQDGGNTWQVKLDDITIDDHRVSHLENLACYKNTCLAVSDYRAQLVLLLSRDEGNSWQLLSTSYKTPDQTLSMTLKKSICTDKSCSVIGRFHLSRGTRPLLATVNLNESDNKYHLLSNDLDPNVELKDIHCRNSQCTIAGNFEHYSHSGGDNDDTPIVLESNDMMMSWNDISDKNYIFKRGDLVSINSMAWGIN